MIKESPMLACMAIAVRDPLRVPKLMLLLLLGVFVGEGEGAV